MNFSEALEELKLGARAARSSWVGKWVGLVPNWNFENLAQWSISDRAPFLLLHTADGTVVPWFASQTDLLAEDWEIVP
jgi:hypothetical protein